MDAAEGRVEGGEHFCTAVAGDIVAFVDEGEDGVDMALKGGGIDAHRGL